MVQNRIAHRAPVIRRGSVVPTAGAFAAAPSRRRTS